MRCAFTAAVSAASLWLAACGSSSSATPAPTWTPTGSMTSVRNWATATVLDSGEVLVAGGLAGADPVAWALASTELYDPVSARWRATTGPMQHARYAHGAELLTAGNPGVPGPLVGQVLVMGGVRGAPHCGEAERLSSAELYDPASGRWTATGALGVARNQFVHALLDSGQVLVAGGWVDDGPCGSFATPTATAELYDGGAATWSRAEPMATARGSAAGVKLDSGRLLVVGGLAATVGDSPDSPLPDAEQYDPGTGHWSPAGTLVSARCCGFVVVKLPSGKVLAAGGFGSGSTPIAQAELFDPATGQWRATGAMHRSRTWFRAVLLPSGKVLALGGAVDASAELYDPATGSWSPAGLMTTQRQERPIAAALPSGRVLVAGGDDGMTALSSAELFDFE